MAALKSMESLSQEHGAILRLLDALEAVAHHLAVGTAVPGELLREVLEALGVHIEQIHMSKEERVLFPYLEAHGMPRSTAVVAALASQHDTARVYARDLQRLADRIVAGDAGARDAVAPLAREFVALVREHIHIEDAYFYSLADRALPLGADGQLLRMFQEVDRVTSAAARREATEALLARVGTWRSGN